MRRIETIAEVRAAIAAERARGARIGFVPTMGFLHEGHLRLVDEAKRRTGCVVMSLLSADAIRGERGLLQVPAGSRRRGQSRRQGVDLMFEPDVSEMYPAAPSLHVMADDLPTRWKARFGPDTSAEC